MQLPCLIGIVLAAMMSPGAMAAPPPAVATALAMLKHGSAELANAWRYEETITSAKGSERLSYDPARGAGARWRILSVNGKAPSDAARKRLATQAAEAVKTAQSGIAVGTGWLAASDYRLVKTTDKTLVYQLRPRLRPRPTNDEDTGAPALLRHLAGEFVIARGDHRPLSLRLDNFESFSPRFGVKIEAFGFRAEFKRLGDDGPIVVVRTSNSARGKVFWIKRFEDKTEVVLSDFAPVAATPASPISTTHQPARKRL